MNKPLSIIGVCVVLGFSSCGLMDKSERKETSKHLSFTERLNERNGYKQDANGNWVPMGDKRSSFESYGRSPYFKGQKTKKAFNTDSDSFAKKQWKHKDFATKGFENSKDGNRFAKNSKFSQQLARESSRDHDHGQAFQTDGYNTQNARENSQDGIDKPSDYQTEKRREVYIPPEIIDYKQQRQMSVDDSKGILGRLRD